MMSTLEQEKIGTKEVKTLSPNQNNNLYQEIFFLLLTSLIAYLAIKLATVAGGGIFLTLLTFVFCASVLIYLKIKALILPKAHYFYLAYVLLLSLSLSLYENKLLATVNVWMLVFALIYWLLVVMSARKTGQLDQQLWHDFLDSLVVRPFTFTKKLALEPSEASARKSSKSQVLKILLGLVIAAPILLIVLLLLINADVFFSKMVNALFSFSLANLWQQFWMILLAVAIGLYLTRMVEKNVKAKKIEHGQVKAIPNANVVFLTIVGVFILIYALFLAASVVTCVQLLSSADKYQVVKLARNGFFQLLVVALINVVLFLIVKILSDNTKAIKISLSLIGLETLGIIVSALLKMLLYISHFGLTILRFNTAVFMIILFVCVVIFICALWKKFNYLRLTVMVVALAILDLSFNNSGNMIANYNYQEFRSGRIAQFDVSILDKVGVEAVPTAIDIYQTTDDTQLENQVQTYLLESKNDMKNQVGLITVQRLQAYHMIRENLKNN